MDPRNAIEVRGMSKYFKINRDKAKTLKEKILFFHRGNNEIHEVLKDINLNIKKGEENETCNSKSKTGRG